MTKVVKGIKSLFSGGSDKQVRAQMRAIQEAQAEQRRMLEEERRRTEAIEAGQRRVLTGGRGLLAFIEDELRRTFG